jgi:hypothetical protein
MRARAAVVAKPLSACASQLPMVDLPRFQDDDLRAELGEAAGQLTLTLEGDADARSQSALENLLVSVHDEAVRRGAPEVTVDFRDCDFVNSSCLKAFIVWLDRIQKLPPGQHYRLRFLADEGKPWQRRSFQAIAALAGDLFQIEVTKRGA